jgi:hypothetical protein
MLHRGTYIHTNHVLFLGHSPIAPHVLVAPLMYVRYGMIKVTHNTYHKMNPVLSSDYSIMYSATTI